MRLRDALPTIPFELKFLICDSPDCLHTIVEETKKQVLGKSRNGGQHPPPIETHTQTHQFSANFIIGTGHHKSTVPSGGFRVKPMRVFLSFYRAPPKHGFGFPLVSLQNRQRGPTKYTHQPPSALVSHEKGADWLKVRWSGGCWDRTTRAKMALFGISSGCEKGLRGRYLTHPVPHGRAFCHRSSG